MSRPRLFLLALLLLTRVTLAQNAQAEESRFWGGPFLGGGGIFNLDRSTSDLALELGGALEVLAAERVSLKTSLGFLANVSDNDAFDDRSAMFTAGLGYNWKGSSGFDPFLQGGYALTSGEEANHHFGFFGAGVRHWYEEKIGWQVEVRDHVSNGVNFLQVRLDLLLR